MASWLSRTLSIFGAKATKRRRLGAVVRRILGGAMPGGWRQDYRKLANRYVGWSYIAIRTIALQGSQADVSCYHDVSPTQGRQFRKRMRRLQRQGIGKAYNSDDALTDALPADHPLCEILRRPNPWQSGSAFMFARLVQLNLTGRSFVWNVKNGYGKIVQRYVVPTAWVEPLSPTDEHPDGAWYINPDHAVRPDADGFTRSLAGNMPAPEYIPVEDMQLVQWTHPLYTDEGYGPLAASALWSDADLQIYLALHAQMRRGVNPDEWFKAGDDVDWESEEDVQRFIDSIADRYGGSGKHGGIGVVPPGTEIITASSTSPKDMAYKEAAHFMRDAQMAAFGVTPVAAGMVDASSYSAFYAALKQTSELTSQPQLDMIGEEDTNALRYSYGDTITIEYDAPSIDDPDLIERQLQADIQGGAITIGEHRALRNRPLYGDERDEQRVIDLQQAAAPVEQQESGGMGMPGTGNDESKPAGADGQPTTGLQQPISLPLFSGSNTNGHHSTNGAGGKRLRVNLRPLGKRSRWTNYP